MIVDTRKPLNVSSHDPVTAMVQPSIINIAGEKPSAKITLPPRIKWSKVDLAAYTDSTETRLNCLGNQMEGLPASIIATRLNQILTDCAIEAAPPPTKRRKRTKYIWCAPFTALAQKANNAYKALKTINPDKRPKSPEQLAMLAAKKILRKAQRQVAAKRRRDVNTHIMDACRKKGRDGFFELIDKQRKVPNQSTKIDFGTTTTSANQANSWARYYSKLATPQADKSYDTDYHHHLQLSYFLQALVTNSQQPVMATVAEVSDHVHSLKNGKAPDAFGVAAEHLKFASKTIMPILCHLVNLALKTGKLPDCYKLGSVIPVLKKAKPPCNPDSYRRITITAIVGKVVEKQLIKMSRPTLDSLQSRLQYGFTSGISPIYAATILTEIMAEAKDTKTELYVAFLDTAKAFDVVDHKGMLNALYRQGVTSNEWQLYNSLYDGVLSRVKADSTLSDPFTEGQGIRQGGCSSTDCYKAGKNALLSRLDTEPTFRIGCTNLGAIMVADDLALVASKAHDMQSVLITAEVDASRERYKYNTDKTKVVPINVRNKPDFVLNGKPLGISSAEVHLGIHRTSDNKNSLTVEARIKGARRAAYKLRGAGLVGYIGVGPEVALVEYSTYIIPTLLYGLEALVLSSKEVAKLELYHRKNLRYIQHLPQSTATPAIHLLTGIPPVEALIDIRTLALFRNILGADQGIPPAQHIRELVIRQAAIKGPDSASWVVHVKQLLHRYMLPSIFDIIASTPTRCEWKSTSKSAVLEWWSNQLKEDASSMSTLALLNLDACYLGHLHPVWCGLSSAHDILKATVKAQVLVGRYPLATTPVSGRKSTGTCPLCKKEPETLTHFLFQCPELAEVRRPYLCRILEACRLHGVPIDPNNLLKYVLDPDTCSEWHNVITRNLLFKLHHTRAVKLGGNSAYKLSSR